jgi:hypothetical protein
MTIIKEGAGGIWHIYDKDTGKGKRLVVRTSHSVQSSPTLKNWQKFFADQAHAGYISRKAKELCITKAEEDMKKDPSARERYFRVYTKDRKVCKMSVLRQFLHDVLIDVAKSPNRPEESKRAKAATTGGAAGGGATSEIRGIEF